MEFPSVKGLMKCYGMEYWEGIMEGESQKEMGCTFEEFLKMRLWSLQLSEGDRQCNHERVSLLKGGHLWQ